MTTLDTLRQLLAEATPGPWKYRERVMGLMSTTVTAGDLSHVAYPIAQAGPANARLIAAAPTHLADLITALEREQRIREVHKPTECRCGCSTECIHCQTSYPCPTIRILDGNE